MNPPYPKVNALSKILHTPAKTFYLTESARSATIIECGFCRRYTKQGERPNTCRNGKESPETPRLRT